MPLINSNFNPLLPFKNGHLNTIYRPLFVKDTHDFERERIDTWDNDFLDLDWSKVGSKDLVLLIHGLEGSSKSNYMITCTKEFNKAGIDTVSLNLRGCSGEDNKLLTTYHSGKTDDVDFVVQHLVSEYNYENISIVGFSLGGNLTLKYFGEYNEALPKNLKCGIAVCVPIDLTSSGHTMSQLKNKIYMDEFLKTLRIKVLDKADKFPEFELDRDELLRAKNFKDFDSIYTAPVFGFESPEDYWIKASSKPYINRIKKPFYLIQSLDDPFLPEECYPYIEAESMPNFYLETPKYGGHVGFISSFKPSENRWVERRILNFIVEQIY